MAHKRSPRILVTLIGAYADLLEEYSLLLKSKPATVAAQIIQKEMDSLLEMGVIGGTSEINKDLIDFIKSLAGKETELDLEKIAEVTGVSTDQLELLQKMCLCTNTKAKRSAFKTKETGKERKKPDERT